MKQQKFTAKEAARLKKSGMEHIIIHWACNADLAKAPKIFTAGEGCYVYDIEGNKYLDTFSSLITTTLGHNRPEIKEAVMEQMDKLSFFPNYHDCFTVPLIKLAETIAEIMPGDLGVSFFLNSGSEANETALKMARQYHWANGLPHRYKVIARKNSYHGTTLGAVSCTGFPALNKCLQPMMPGCVFAPPASCNACDLGLKPETCGLGCLKAMEKIIQWEHPETISAVIMDPLPGSNSGYPLPPDGYLKGVRELCDKHGILLIFDEIQTGFGKTGKWFACENWNVTPDIMAISKALTSGYLPLGVTVTTQKIADRFRKPGDEFASGSTYGGHPLSCAAALATIEIMRREKLVERAAETGKYLKSRLEELYEHKIVGDIRGIGTLWAIELMADRKTRKKLDADAGTFIRDWCWENGMILRNNRNSLVIAPALIITKEEIDIMIGKLKKALSLAKRNFSL
jgi:adenosylmethionine-8-amino-7-oxononanoate aminotransferase